MLKVIKSGGQCGVDIVSLNTAKKFGLERGGMMPKGFKTQYGPRPQWAKEHNLTEHSSPAYPPRTMENVKNSDATMRLYFDENSAGEKLTLKFIKQYNKIHFDVDLSKPPPPAEAARWLTDNNIEVLNVAGNSEKTYAGVGIAAEEYLSEVFTLLGFTMKA